MTDAGRRARVAPSGIRVFGLDANFKPVSYPLAVRLFKPGPGVDDARAGGMVKLWAQQVLEEFGMEWSDVLGAVTGAGSNVELAFSNVEGVLRESCLPHMLHGAMIEGFGVSVSRSASKNASARQAISEVKGVVDRMNRSDEEKASPRTTRASRARGWAWFYSARWPKWRSRVRYTVTP